MKYSKLIILLLLITFSSSGILTSYSNEETSSEDEEWYPFALTEQMDPDSPANIGKLILDSPAGKHGFLKVSGNRFVFEDGTPIKFWGINLCFSASFPDKKQAEIMAKRLAFFGFNAVRLQHMDYYFEPKGIFEDVSPAYKDPQLKETGHLSKAQLNRLDYLIYQLKIQGIYIDIPLLVSRRFTEADGLKDAQSFGLAAKPLSLFDRNLIELQKKYAKDLLTHNNPYTGLQYYNDPAIALIEITNENTLLDIDTESLPDYYQRQFQTRFVEWQKKNNQSINRIKAFTIHLESQYSNEMVNFLHEECKIKVPITGIGGHVKWGDIRSQEICDFIDIHEYWDHPSFPGIPWDQSNFQIHNKSIFADSNLGIVGRMPARIPADLTKPFTLTEWSHSYPNVYAYETPLLLANKANQYNCAGLFQFAYSHGWFTVNDLHSFFDIHANSQQLILSSLGSLLYQTHYNQADIENGILKINTPIVEGLIGNIEDKQFEMVNISIVASENGAVILYSPQMLPIAESDRLVLVSLSEVKNSNSEWKENRFNWGKPPALLKKIKCTISLQRNKPSKVYEITADGKRGIEIKSTYDQNKLSFTTTASTPWFEIISD